MRVCVLGGGLSGLTTAHRLARSGADVEVLEASSRVGGLLGTEVHDDCIVETGPDSILTEKPAALALAEELGLGAEVIGTSSNMRGAYIVRRGRLMRIPAGFSLLAPADLAAFARSPILSPQGKLRASLDLVLPRGEGDDESLESFVVRRFGRELFERLAQPLAGGIYGADPAKLSLRATMPRFLELEREYGSVIRGLRARARAAVTTGEQGAATGARYGLFAAFKGGMQALVDALERALTGHIRRNRRATAVHKVAGGYRVEAGGDAAQYDALVVALPAHAAARGLGELDRALSDELGGIEYASAATVTLSFPRAAIAHPLDAFGFVVPAVEQRRIIASTWASVKYEGRAPEGTALIRAFIGGHRGQHLVERSDDELCAIARDELQALMGISGAPSFSLVNRYLGAMPQYHLGHQARVARIEQLERRHQGFALAGNAYRGVGIPDAVKSGEEAAQRILSQRA